jgi:hypothetical protein
MIIQKNSEGAPKNQINSLDGTQWITHLPSIDYSPATHDRSEIELFSWLLLTLMWQGECKGINSTSNHLTHLLSSTKSSNKANSECQL